MGLQISFLAEEIGGVGKDTTFRVALNCYDESKTHPYACNIYLVLDVRGVQAQRAELYCVGSVSIERHWKGWNTSQFLVQPIWIPPIDTSSMRYQSERTELQNQKSEGFMRMKEIAKIERRNRETEARRQDWSDGIWTVICALCCVLGAAGGSGGGITIRCHLFLESRS
jgi:hypothetical protein